MFSLECSLKAIPLMLLNGVSTLLLRSSESRFVTVLIFVSVVERFILSMSTGSRMDLLMLLPGFLQYDFWMAFPTLCCSLSSFLFFYFLCFPFVVPFPFINENPQIIVKKKKKQ
ncbi:hypothetical protein AMTRI_Chr06g194490 [Amborella trichopoda]